MSVKYFFVSLFMIESPRNSAAFGRRELNTNTVMLKKFFALFMISLSGFLTA